MNRSSKTSSLRLCTDKVFALLLLMFSFINIAIAQENKIDLNALTSETQQTSNSANKLELIWWMPEEFWQASFQQDPHATPAQAETIMKTLRPYTVLVAVDGDIGSMGGVTYKPQATVRNSLQVVDAKGVHYRPLSDDKISPDARNFLAMMKPVLANMLGAMGQNMNFFVFPTVDKAGKNVINAKTESNFSVLLNKTEFKWRLPLSSLLHPKICPVDGEKLSGAWKFCPWHGVELK